MFSFIFKFFFSRFRDHFHNLIASPFIRLIKYFMWDVLSLLLRFLIYYKYINFFLILYSLYSNPYIIFSTYLLVEFVKEEIENQSIWSKYVFTQTTLIVVCFLVTWWGMGNTLMTYDKSFEQLSKQIETLEAKIAMKDLLYDLQDKK